MSTATAPATALAVSQTARWRVLLGAVIVQLILGTVYGYSIFWTPLEDHVFPRVIIQGAASSATAAPANLSVVSVPNEAAASKLHTEQTGKLKYAFGVCILAFALVMVFAGRVQDRRGPVLTALAGGGLLGGGFLVAGLLLQARPAETISLLGLWLTIGLLAGAGIGFAYVCPIAALVKWFPDKKGLVSGIAVAGFGFGAYFFSSRDLPIGAPAFIDTHGIPSFFLMHGVVCLVAVSIGALMLSNPPGAPPRASQEADWKEMLRRPAFYMLWPMFFSGALAGLTVIVIMKDFAGEQILAAHTAGGAALTEAMRADLLRRGAAAVGMLAIFNAVGRVVWGLLSDRIGRTSSFVLKFALQACVLFALPAMRSEMAIAVAACAIGFNFGGNFALFPSATADLFGARNLGANYGLVFTSYGIAGVVGTFSGNLAKALAGSFDAAFYLAGVLCVVSAGLAVALHASRSRTPATA
ncbi:MAG: OFA family MFS transporter [Chthonomonadales bacterium]|nr:OFA family MFS transporter [Chthonomonadales bacterium]